MSKDPKDTGAQQVLGDKAESSDISKQDPLDKEPSAKRLKTRSQRDKDNEENLEALDHLKKLLREKEDELKFTKQSHKRQLKSLQDHLDAEKDSLIRMKEDFNHQVDENERLEEEIKTLREDNDEKDSRIKELLQLRKDKEMECADLLEQLDAMESPTQSPTSPKAKFSAMFVCDNATKVLAQFLPDVLKWTIVESSLVNVKDSDLENHEVALFISGMNDLAEAANQSKLIQDARQTKQRAIDANCLPIFLPLPPANKRSLSGKVSLFNYKLAKLDTVIFKPDMSTLPKTSFLENDGVTLSYAGGKMFLEKVLPDLTELPLQLPKLRAALPPRSNLDTTSTSVKSPSPGSSTDLIKQFVAVENFEKFIGKVVTLFSD